MSDFMDKVQKSAGASAAANTESEASAWYARLRGRDADHGADQSDIAAFEAWRVASPAHEREYRRLEALWGDMETLEDSPEVALGRRYAAAFMAEATEASETRRPPTFARRPIFAAAASLALIFVATVIFLNVDRPIPGRYETALGEQRTVALADQSTILLNTLTTIEVHYTLTERRIDLLDGQASFDVVPDHGRPFVVVAGSGTIRALGTRFDVYKAGEVVTVTLLEGEVEVRGLQGNLQEAAAPAYTRTTLANRAAPPMPEISPRRVAVLHPGQRVSYATGTAISPVTSVDIARASAWRHGKLDFEDATLAEVVAEINRYSASQIVLGDESLAALRVSGIFEAGKTEDLVKAIQGYFDVQVARFPNQRIVLTAKDEE